MLFNKRLLFIADAEHIRYVKNILDPHSVVVRYRETTSPPKARALPMNFRFYRNVFHLAHENHANTIIFCAVTTPGLISIKALLTSYRDIVCLVVPHDTLQDVTRVQSLRPDRLFF
jgi:hypothetical protein